MEKKKRISLINGPNLNLLGIREPSIYGSSTLVDLVQQLTDKAEAFGVEIDDFQSNSEGAIVDQIQMAEQQSAGIIINPGAYSHTSVAIRDACSLCSIPIIEVHISNIFAREEFRHHSYISPVVSGVIVGFGIKGYHLALTAVLELYSVRS